MSAAAIVLGMSTNAFAADTFPGTSHMTDVRVEFTSSRWTEEAYTELRFTGCNSASDHSVSPEIMQDNDLWPDYYYGEKTFTACFDGGTSAGTESGLERGRYYFRINKIDDSMSALNLLDVKKVVVDSTLAD
ncbi:hypothetical protein ABZ490_46910 [Streptomyces sp. NPDC005811]|uniref:hypothetical protein n=1 Tax=Streptomyces sp. NPDC005811 TaxID=3154565 RepID=UPI0034050794